MKDCQKSIHIEYYAVLREERGMGAETVQTAAETPGALYQELADKHGFTLRADQLKVAVNTEIRDWESPVSDGDTVIFLPPVSGG